MKRSTGMYRYTHCPTSYCTDSVKGRRDVHHGRACACRVRRGGDGRPRRALVTSVHDGGPNARTRTHAHGFAVHCAALAHTLPSQFFARRMCRSRGQASILGRSAIVAASLPKQTDI
eukprot:6172406-Pleurochrysis_carterae.AAC.3